MRSSRSPSSRADARWVRASRVAVIAVAIALFGCKSNVITGVAEYDANEAVSLLLSSGIRAEKVPVGEQGFDVVVQDSDFGRALSLMTDAGLPRERRASLGELFKREGLVSTAAEERIRYAFGLSQELERTIASIDGVASARVHVAMPSADPLATHRKPASASIFVRYREPAEPLEIGPLIRGIVIRAIEGLDAERVSIAFTPAMGGGGRATAEPVSWMGLRVAPDSLGAVRAMVLLPWVLFAALLAVGLYLRFGGLPGRGATPDGRTASRRSVAQAAPRRGGTGSLG
ncbi:MAG: type secretion protein [Pseudomonadota bacterium]